MEQQHDFTKGPILPLLLRFALPVLLALLLQAMYGAVDLQVVGRFGTAVDISAVSTGGQIMQSMSAFVAQNIGAGQARRAARALWCGVATSLAAGFIMGWFTFFHGDILVGLFVDDAAVIAAAWEYLKAYAIDCLLTAILFCFVGFFNGCGKTVFVMLQGVIGAFCVRIPVVYLMSALPGATLFHVGLGTPASSLVQIALCLLYYRHLQKKGQLF